MDLSFFNNQISNNWTNKENTIFCLGRYKGKIVSKNFKKLVGYGKKETYSDIEYKLKYHDYLSRITPGKLLLR